MSTTKERTKRLNRRDKIILEHIDLKPMINPKHLWIQGVLIILLLSNIHAADRPLLSPETPTSLTIDFEQISDTQYLTTSKFCLELNGVDLGKTPILTNVDAAHVDYVEYENSSGVSRAYPNSKNETQLWFPSDPHICLVNTELLPFNITYLNEFYSIYGVALAGQTDRTIDNITLSLLYPTQEVITRDFFAPDRYISLILVNGTEAKKLQVVSSNDSTKISLGKFDKLNSTKPALAFYFYVTGRPRFYSEIKDTVDIESGTLTRKVSIRKLNETIYFSQIEEKTDLDLVYRTCDWDLLAKYLGYPFDCYQVVIPSRISSDSLNLNKTDGVLTYYSVLIKANNFQIDTSRSGSHIIGNTLQLPLKSLVTEIDINNTILDDLRYLTVQTELGQGILYLPRIINAVVEGQDTPAGTPAYLAEANLPLLPPIGGYDLQNILVVRRGINHILLWALVMTLCGYGGWRYCEKKLNKSSNKPKTNEWLVETVIVGIYLSWVYFVISIQSLKLEVMLLPVGFVILGYVLKWGEKQLKK